MHAGRLLVLRVGRMVIVEQGMRYDIQGIRALAVLAVVLYHAQVPWFAGGYVGVDIFFVISGYLITGSLVSELTRNGRIDLPAFYARRIRRLLPAGIVVLVATAVAMHSLLSPIELRELGKSILFSAVYAVNFHFAFEATDYLAGDVHANPVLHMWSLAVEEQFYLVWPFLILLSAAVARGRPLGAKLQTMVASVIVVSFGTSLWVFGMAKPWAFFGSPFRAWEFATGGLVYLLCTPSPPAREASAFRHVTAYLGLVLMLAAIVTFDDSTPFPGYAALLPVAGAALLIGSARGEAVGSLRWMRIGPIQRIGDLSYSWYLWHWPLMVLPAAVRELDTWDRVGFALVALLLAWLTFFAIENPVRYWTKLTRARPRRTIVLGAMVTFAGLTAGAGLYVAGKQGESAPGQREIAATRNLRSVLNQDKCHSDTLGTDVRECNYGNPSGSRTIFLLGDSHAAHWFPAFEHMASEQDLRLVVLTKSACPMAALTVYLASHGRPYHECDRWRDAVMARILREGPWVVVIGQSSKYIWGGKSGVSDADWVRGMRDTVRALAHSVGHVVVLRDTPWPGFDVPTCLSRALWRGLGAEQCDYERTRAQDQRVVALDRIAVDRIQNVKIVDLTDLVCSRPRCAVVDAEHIVFSDSHHLAVDYSRSLAPTLWQRLSIPIGAADSRE